MSENIIKQDICELFGLNSTDTCNIDFPINKNTGKLKGLAFIRAPANTTDEVIKFNGITYYDNELRVGEATLTGKRTNNKTSNEFRRPSVVVNNQPGNQHFYRKNVLHLKVTFRKEKNK